MKQQARLSGVMALAALTVLTSVGPTSALAFKGHGFYARFGLGGHSGGIVVVDKVQDGEGRMSARFAALPAGGEYFLAGRSIGCDGQPLTANRVFMKRLRANVDGVISANDSITLPTGNAVKSMWLGPTDGSQPPACSGSLFFDKLEVAAGDVNGDGELGLVNSNGGVVALAVVERGPAEIARVSVVVHGLDGNDTFSIVGSKRPCSRQASAASNAYQIVLEDVLDSTYAIHDIHMNQGNLNALRSLRLRNETKSTYVGCAPSVLIALLLP